MGMFCFISLWVYHQLFGAIYQFTHIRHASFIGTGEMPKCMDKFQA